MPQQLWLLRHGEAEPHHERPDFERRLTPRGEDQSRSAGRALAALSVEFQLVFTSPRVRALQTAQLACADLGLEPVVHEPLSDGFELADARELLNAVGDDRRILLVGHEPDLSRLVGDLTGGAVDMKKGGIAAMRVEGSRGELIALLRPRELDRIR